MKIRELPLVFHRRGNHWCPLADPLEYLGVVDAQHGASVKSRIAVSDWLTKLKFSKIRTSPSFNLVSSHHLALQLLCPLL